MSVSPLTRKALELLAGFADKDETPVNRKWLWKRSLWSFVVIKWILTADAQVKIGRGTRRAYAINFADSRF